MKPIELMKDIYWVGALDWSLRDFHGYSTEKGSTYNAYLIIDDKITLVDTVKSSHKLDLEHRIRNLIDPREIDYIVVNHVEMDHSGSLPEMVELIEPEKIICSKMAHKALVQHFHQEDWPYEIVESGSELSLGRKTLSFLETRMLHWPDSMFTYVKEDKLLFSSDAFGQHYATSERFDDEVNNTELMHQAAKYYANILTLYSPLVEKLLKKVAEIGLDINMIAPDHGLIWRGNPGQIIDAYDRWSSHESLGNVLVIYDTMWESTEKMAKAVADGIEEEGVSIQLFNLKVNHRSDVMTEVLQAGGIVLGCPTLNNGMLPRMADFLMYMRGLRPANKVGAAFGSFGWSGESVKLLNEAMEEMKFEIIDPGIRVKYVPGHEQLKECRELGNRIAREIRGRQEQ